MARVLLFAGVRSALGRDEITIACGEGISEEAFWTEALEKFPALAPWRTQCRLARNHAFLAPNQLLSDADIIAILPPVSGG